MIIRSLVDYYEQLRESGAEDVPGYGWLSQSIHYYLLLAPDGRLQSIAPCGSEGRGVVAIVPQKLRGTSDGKANFLWDSALYLLGVREDGQLEPDLKSFNKSKALHEEVLADCEGEVSKAIKNFYARWDPSIEKLDAVPGFSDDMLSKGKFLAFCIASDSGIAKASEDYAIKRGWDTWYSASSDLPVMVSLVTGNVGPIALKHPIVKGIGGGTSKLVSFNQEAFESYGHVGQQGRNAPVDLVSAHAYASALNYLAANPEHRSILNGATTLYWSSSLASDQANCSVFSLVMGFTPAGNGGNGENGQLLEIGAVVKSLSKGKPVHGGDIVLDDEFFLLGVDASSKGRLSVRFYLHDTFGDMMRHVVAHYRIAEVCHRDDAPAFVTPYSILKSIEKPKSDNKAKGKSKNEFALGSPLGASLLRAVLLGGRYPEALYKSVLLRIHSKGVVWHAHASIIRAYLIRNANKEESEVTVNLNTENTDTAYLLGRAFRIMETIQWYASKKETLAGRYLGSASASPSTTFPVLLRLNVAHRSKLAREKPKLCTALEKQLAEALGQIGPVFPKHLSLNEQGGFFLGYYQQKWNVFRKGDEEEE